MTIQEFAKKVEEGEMAGLRRAKLDCEANLNNAKTTVKPGKRWTRVDVGTSGRCRSEKHVLKEENKDGGV